MTEPHVENKIAEEDLAWFLIDNYLLIELKSLISVNSDIIQGNLLVVCNMMKAVNVFLEALKKKIIINISTF